MGSMFRRAESVEASYEALVGVLTSKNNLNLIASVIRSLNREVMELTRGMTEVFQSLEKINTPTRTVILPADD